MTEHLSRPPYKLYSRKSDRKALILAVVLSVAVILALWGICTGAMGAEEIDVDIIAQIESSNNPLAYNYKSEARGLCQITPIVLKEFNHHNNTYTAWEAASVSVEVIKRLKERIAIEQLYDSVINYWIANWYINRRIPQMLKSYRLTDTIDARLACYNAGIGTYQKYKQGKRKLPSETINYIKKYKKLAKAN